MRRKTSLLLALAALALLSNGSLAAADSSALPVDEAITLNAGETRVIENLDPAATPDIRVIQNPHALVVNSTEPGKLVLVGAEEGKWDILARRADNNVTYHVTVHALHDWSNPLKPDKMPGGSDGVTSAGSGSASSASAPVVAAAAPGTTSATTAPPVPTPDSGITVRPIAPLAPPVSPYASTTAARGGGAPVAQSQVFMSSDPSVVSSGEGYSTEGVAASGGTHYLPADGISLAAGTSKIFDFVQKMRRVSIADTEVADVQVINPFQLNLIGHKPGFTTISVWTGQGHYEERQVRVDPYGKQQVMLNCVVAELNRTRIENQGANLSAALSKYGVSLVGLPGAVATPYSPQSSAVAVLPNGTTFTGGSQTLPPGGSLIPMLLSQNITYGLAAQNSNVQTQSLFNYLEQHNLAKILAEPHLLANSGEKAKFLSGGEIPIVIAQALNTSIVFKEFGTKVAFVPTVVGVNDIEVLVQPEVSEPDYSHAVQMFGFMIPAFVARRAETMVRLRDAQTLIIAGLILHTKREIIDKVPYLGDIPFAGGLFRNTSWQDNENDLVMAVTPQIVRPLPTGAEVRIPINVPQLTAEDIRTHRLSTPDAARPRF